jgi:chemotaxis signal transduction protein
MEAKQDSTKDFLAQNDAIIDRLREVALHEFEKGVDGLRLIIKELTSVQKLAAEGGLQGLFDCLSEISTVLQGWLADPVFIEQAPSLKDLWSDVICELSNYFVFLGEEDESDLRNRVNYRLIQLVKASAQLAPAPAPTELTSDGSWGLFDESTVEAPLPTSAAAPRLSQEPLAPAKASTPAQTVAPSSKTEAPSDNHLASHYLICLLGTQQYALPIHQVREILEQRLEKALPSQRPGIRGLVTVRGMVCPVVDVSDILHAKDENNSAAKRKKRCMVVCEVDRRTFCFNVDDVKQVAALEEFDDQITPLNPDSSIQKAISHVSHFQNKSVLFVKMREVIPA